MGNVLDAVQFLTGGLLTNRILTREQAYLLKSDNVVSPDARGFADLGITPTAVEAVAPDYLWRFRPSGQYADIKDPRVSCGHIKPCPIPSLPRCWARLRA